MDLKSSDEIEHTREYVPILQNENEAARAEVDVRLVLLLLWGLNQVQGDWRKTFDFNKVPPLSPKIPWMEEIPKTEIHTFLKKALERAEEEGQEFEIPASPSYRDFDHVLEVAFAMPLLKELRTGYQHKNAVKDIVREFLERKTYNLPAGVPAVIPARIIESSDEGAQIALGNLARPEVIEGVRKQLLAPIHEALTTERPSAEAQMSTRKASELSNYQALKKHVLKARKSSFTTVAVDSAEELRAAALLDRTTDVVGWVYNHRSGVGYFIEYDWQGYTARYYPDFIVRAKFGEVFHNFIVEVKGRMDERDRRKAKRAKAYCEMLTEYDKEPWHYILLMENKPEKREDITWWEKRTGATFADLLKHHEGLPLYPKGASNPPAPASLRVVPSVPKAEQYEKAVPVYDLAVAAGGFGTSQSPQPIGWMHVKPSRPVDKRMFVAQVVGSSMEDGIPNGVWGLFRLFLTPPSPTAIDGRRVVVQLHETDPDTGGQYTLKRWRVTKYAADGGVERVELRPDNPDYKSIKLSAKDGEIRPVAEFLEIVS